MGYRNKNLIILLIISGVIVIGIDGLKIQKIKQQLISECVLVGKMISKSGGVSNTVIEYVKKKELLFEYPSTNSKNDGDIVEFALIYTCNNIFIRIKEIKMTYYVILGSII